MLNMGCHRKFAGRSGSTCWKSRGLTDVILIDFDLFDCAAEEASTSKSMQERYRDLPKSNDEYINSVKVFQSQFRFSSIRQM